MPPKTEAVQPGTPEPSDPKDKELNIVDVQDLLRLVKKHRTDLIMGDRFPYPCTMVLIKGALTLEAETTIYPTTILFENQRFIHEQLSGHISYDEDVQSLRELRQQAKHLHEWMKNDSTADVALTIPEGDWVTRWRFG